MHFTHLIILITLLTKQWKITQSCGCWLVELTSLPPSPLSDEKENKFSGPDCPAGGDPGLVPHLPQAVCLGRLDSVLQGRCSGPDKEGGGPGPQHLGHHHLSGNRKNSLTSVYTFIKSEIIIDKLVRSAS